MTDPTNFMKMFFHSTALCSMTAVSEKKEKDEGWNTDHVPGTVLVTLGIFFLFSPHNNAEIFTSPHITSEEITVYRIQVILVKLMNL